MYTNIKIEDELWKEAKKVCIDRKISLSQLITNGLHLALNHDDVIKVDKDGKITNDLQGFFTR